jgi:hypothetical protein
MVPKSASVADADNHEVSPTELCILLFLDESLYLNERG